MKTLINDGWYFAKLSSGSTPEDAEKACFEPVDLPHDWLIWQEGDLYESADAWYRRIIEIPETKDEVVLIRFDGVYMDCDILLNGEIIFTHPYGYTAFDVPLTGKLIPGKNILTVHIRHQSPNSRWYSGSGIFRDVFLDVLPKEYIIPDSLLLNENVADGQYRLNIAVETGGDYPQPFFCALYDREGCSVTAAQGHCSGGKAEATLTVTDRKEWSPENPYLYQLELTYGKQKERYKIGLRSVFMDPDKGLFLNGKHIRLKGVCLHHDLGALGAAFHEKAARRQLQLMKDMGANAVRTSHNPPASAFLDLCDEMGLLVVDEAFDMWERPKTEYDYARFFSAHYKEDVASWIRRDRRHPCIIMWSIGNEIYDMHADIRGTEVTRMLAEQVRIHDPWKHAATTFGCNYMPWEGGQRCAEYVDAVGYNYGEKLYEKHHRDHPSWVIYGSETSSILSSRGIYHFPIEQSIMSEADRQCSALGNSNTSWGAESLAKILAAEEKQPFSMGQFIWSGIDYIGEPTPYHTRSCYFGQADTACFAKDPYYLFQSFWTEQKMIHIGVSWDWNPGQMIDIPVMTNCAAAELFLNGQSMGRKAADHREPSLSVPTWKMPYRPGELRAVGYDDCGKPVCADSRFTPGNTDRLVLSGEDPFLLSDGWDLAFVAVSAEDKEGHPVENARDRVKITVSGGGRLIGTDNGDSTDTDGYKSDCRRLFSGKLLLIIASNGTDENVQVSVLTADGISGSTVIPVRRSELKPGVTHIQKVSSNMQPDTIHARKILLEPMESTELTPDNDKCRFRYTVLPEKADKATVLWQVTNAAGIESPHVKVCDENGVVTVHACGDGDFYLRALCTEDGLCTFISQTEFSASGFGSPALDPYSYVSAGLYDLHEGEIGTGNEKGIAFSRDGASMVGFSCIDFGRTGSDQITADIFALNSDPYDLELWAESAGRQKRKIMTLHYQKPSLWNVYQPETWRLPERLKGMQTLYFCMNDKIHMKGFIFEKQKNAFIHHTAGDADVIYGDCFSRDGDRVTGIGNNVTLAWNDMEFGKARDVMLEIDGKTQLSRNTISIRIRNDQGEETASVAEFAGGDAGKQRFAVNVPSGNCTVSFVFLPGSSFDFNAFRFFETDAFRPGEAESWTEQPE